MGSGWAGADWLFRFRELYSVPEKPESNVVEIRSGFTKIKGQHSFKVRWRVCSLLQYRQEIIEGNLSFDGSLTGYSVGDFLLGTSSKYGLRPTLDHGSCARLSVRILPDEITNGVARQTAIKERFPR